MYTVEIGNGRSGSFALLLNGTLLDKSYALGASQFLCDIHKQFKNDRQFYVPSTAAPHQE